MKSRSIIAAFITLLVCACGGSSLQLAISETECIYPGQTVTIKVHTNPRTELSFVVQDDFGNELEPKIPATTTDGNGDATITWRSPSSLSTTAVHFELTARDSSLQADRDVHVIVGGNGRSC